jgi:polyphenol oxidase
VFAFRASHGPVDLAFTDRFGGVSDSPYAELNLALEDDDDPAARTENLRRVVTDFAPDLVARPDFSLDLQVVRMRQVHGAAVEVVDDRRAGGWRPEADGLVSTDPSAVLVVRVADCVPVLLADADSGVIGVAHAGRPGMVAGVVPETVSVMRRLGAEQITAWIGPHVCGACYEVPAAMQEEVAAQVPESRATTSWGTPALDIGAGVRAQLAAAGATVVDVSRCTRESPDLYSYRRDGARAGRFAGLVRRRSDG